MIREEPFPVFDFDFQKIREHWKLELGDYEAAAEYLEGVERRLHSWLQGLGDWIDFDFAARHLREDLHLSQVESHLRWLVLKHRARLANEARKRLASADGWRESEQPHAQLEFSAHGKNGEVWHADFRDIYRKAMERERNELRKVRETGAMP